LAVSTDPEHRFELALQLGELKIAYQLATEQQNEAKWKQLADLATSKGQLGLAQECLHKANDYGGLLLLATAAGNAGMVGKLGESAASGGKNNVAFLSFFITGRLEQCLDVLINSKRLPEAAFFARTYLPSEVPRVVALWKQSVSATNDKAARALADPAEYENLFPERGETLRAQQFSAQLRSRTLPARAAAQIPSNWERDLLAETAAATEAGKFLYRPPEAPQENGDLSDPDSAMATAPAAVPTPPTASSTSRPLLTDADDPPVAAAAAERVEPPAAAPAPAPSPTPLVDAAKMDRELDLDLDLDDMNLGEDDDIDVGDINLDEEDLLED